MTFFSMNVNNINMRYFKLFIDRFNKHISLFLRKNSTCTFVDHWNLTTTFALIRRFV